MKNLRKVVLLCLAGVFILGLAFLRKYMSNSDAVYIVGVPTYWGTLTPPLQHSLVGDAVLEYQSEPLARMGGQGVMEPLAAKSWKFSPDHSRLTFTIDTNRRFSDGSYLSAEDFKRSWEDGLRMDPKSSNSSLADGLVNIKGYSDFAKNGELAGVRVTGKDTLEIEFTKPIRLALKYLSGGRFSVYKKAPHGIIGTGPYTITEKDKTLFLTRNPYFAGEKPALKNIKIIVVPPEEAPEKLKAGDIDAYLFAETANLPGCDGDTAASVRCARGQEASHNLMQLNGLKGRFFSKPEHRLAFQALVNRHISEAEKAFSARGFVRDSQSFLKFQSGRIPDDEAQGIIQSGEGFVPEFIKATQVHPLQLASSATGGHWLVNALRKDGVQFTADSEKDRDFKELVEMYYKTSTPDIMTISASVSDGDPDGLYHLIGRHGAIFSPMTERKAVCEGMEEGRRIMDADKLAEHYQNVSRNILKEVPYVHLGYFYRRMAYNAAKLQVNEKLLSRNNPNIMLLKPR